jgi:hypothetical protein
VPRYLVERTFVEGLGVPTSEAGAFSCLAIVEKNSDAGVTWLHSYVTEDRRKTFCIYDGPTPESIRDVAGKNNLPVDRITPVSVLDPYFYRS